MTGELVVAAAARATRTSRRPINDIVLKAIAPDVDARYQRAGDLLTDLLAARGRTDAACDTAAGAASTPPLLAASLRTETSQDIHSRLRARETPQPRFCWHCRKPLHARSARCPFCGEAQ